MKNIHVSPTPNPSRLYYWGGKLRLGDLTTAPKNLGLSNQHIYITSDEEITGFENNIWVYNNGRVWLWQNTMALKFDNKPKKIILTDNPDLIKDGVQAIDDEFLEWFVKNPSCEEIEVLFACRGLDGHTPIGEYRIIIRKEEPKQEKDYTALLQPVGTREETEQELDCPFDFTSRCTMGRCDCKPKQETHLDIKDNKIELLEEDLECIRMYLDDLKIPRNDKDGNKYSIIGRIKWQQERSYSKEEVLEILYKHTEDLLAGKKITLEEWFEQFKNK